MNLSKTRLQVRPDTTDVSQQFASARSKTLVGVEDDMWATFADMAQPYVVVLGDQAIGTFSIDDDKQLHGFYLDRESEQRAADVLALVASETEAVACIASTVDPIFLSLSLSVSSRSDEVAILYEHVAASAVNETVDLRLATSADLDAAIDFCVKEMGAPESFLNGYLAERIQGEELLLVQTSGGQISATGECRVDSRVAGHGHLGLVVASELRGCGLGSRLMNTLVTRARAQGLVPLCSTEPTNLAAQHLIHQTGFRAKHRVLRFQLTEQP